MIPENIDRNVANAIVRRIEIIGKIEDRLSRMANDDIFNNLSKHNPFWESEHEAENDKLYDMRMKLSCFHDNLWDIIALINQESD